MLDLVGTFGLPAGMIWTPTKNELSFVSCQVVFYAALLAVGLSVRAVSLLHLSIE